MNNTITAGCAPATPARRWLYLAVGTLLLILLGLIYAWSVFISPLESEFGWDRAQTSMTFTLSIIFFCIGGILGGVLSKKLSHRAVLGLAACSLLAGFLLSSRVSTLTGIYLAYGVLVGLGVGLAYNVLISGIGLWFPDKKGLCSGILLMGFGIGGMLLGTVTTGLMASVGWRTMFVVFAAVFAALLLLGALIIKAPTAQQRLALAGPVTGVEAKENTRQAEQKPAQMLKTNAFWVYFAWSLLLIASGLIIIGHAAASAGDLGAATQTAAFFAGLVSMANGAGRILMGLLCDRTSLKTCMLVITACGIAAPVLFLLALRMGSMPLLGVGFVLTGIFYGGVPTMNATFASGYYGAAHFPINFSIVNSSLLFAPLLGSYLAGSLRASFGTYLYSYLVMLGFGLVALVFALLMPKKEKLRGE